MKKIKSNDLISKIERIDSVRATLITAHKTLEEIISREWGEENKSSYPINLIIDDAWELMNDLKKQLGETYYSEKACVSVDKEACERPEPSFGVSQEIS